MRPARAGLAVAGLALPNMVVALWVVGMLVCGVRESAAETPKSRFIPVELWTGAAWSGREELIYAPADLSFGGGRKHIVGPIDWLDPVTGRRHKAYRRSHDRDDKQQIFAISQGGQALGRIYDSRYKASIEGGAKFPLGRWHEGETRAFEATYTKADGRSYRRRMTITIEALDFNFAGDEHCLRFRWTTQKPGEDRLRDDNGYTYCPGKGLVDLRDN